MPSTINGIGTRYCGQRDYHPDCSWLTTEWFTLFFIPIFPLRSVRIAWAFERDDLGPLPRSMPQSRVESQFEWGSRTEISHYKFISNESLSFYQVLYVYLYLIGWVLFFPFIIILSYILPHNVITTVLVVIIMILWSLLPWLLRLFARWKVGVKP